MRELVKTVRKIGNLKTRGPKRRPRRYIVQSLVIIPDRPAIAAIIKGSCFVDTRTPAEIRVISSGTGTPRAQARNIPITVPGFAIISERSIKA